MAPFIERSIRFQNRLADWSGRKFEAPGPLLASIDGQFAIVRAEPDLMLHGHPTVGVTFFETARLSPGGVAAARKFPLIVTGYDCNEPVLAAHGISAVKTVHRGIDPALFHPAPASGVMAGTAKSRSSAVNAEPRPSGP